MAHDEPLRSSCISKFRNKLSGGMFEDEIIFMFAVYKVASGSRAQKSVRGATECVEKRNRCSSRICTQLKFPVGKRTFSALECLFSSMLCNESQHHLFIDLFYLFSWTANTFHSSHLSCFINASLCDEIFGGGRWKIFDKFIRRCMK